jgi:hypothetical protein
MHTRDVSNQTLFDMREFFNSLVSRAFFSSLKCRAVEQPVQFVVKPVIKSVVVIVLVTVAAQTLYQRSFDRHGLGKLAGEATKQSIKNGAARR